MKRDIKGPAPVRVRVRVGVSGILSGFSFSGILSGLVDTAEIRGQPLVY